MENPGLWGLVPGTTVLVEKRQEACLGRVMVHDDQMQERQRGRWTLDQNCVNTQTWEMLKTHSLTMHAVMHHQAMMKGMMVQDSLPPTSEDNLSPTSEVKRSLMKNSCQGCVKTADDGTPPATRVAGGEAACGC